MPGDDVSRALRPPPALLAAALGLAVFILLALAALHAQAGGPPENWPGDLTVGAGQTVVLENRTIRLEGNVTVESGGVLELANTTLLFELAANGSFSLTVQGGGTLRVRDLDRDPSTQGDRSEVSSSSSSLRYLVRFESGANVLLANSAITGFGYTPFLPGMLVQTDNATFDHAVIGSYEFLKVEGAAPRFSATFFDGKGTGSNYFVRSAAVLDNCTMSRNYVALSASEGSALTVRGALIRDAGFPLAANGSSVIASDSTFLNSSFGLFLSNGSSFEFTEVEFDESALTFADSASRIVVYRSFTLALVNQAAEPSRNASVSLSNATGGVLSSGRTDSAGHFGPVVLLRNTIDALGSLNPGNYTAYASKGTAILTYNFSALTENSLIALLLAGNLDPRITLEAPSPGSVLLEKFPYEFKVQVEDPDNTSGGVSVVWRSSLQGALGSESSILVVLDAGQHVITVEAADAEDGFRSLSFNVTAEEGRIETYTDGQSPPRASVTIIKTSPGALAVLEVRPASRPLLSFGPAFDVHPASGAVTWGYALVTFAYDPALLPYGIEASSLRLWKYNSLSGTFERVGTSSSDSVNHTVSVSLSVGQGLGTFIIVGAKAPNLPPRFDELHRLVAVRGSAFLYRIAAKDTPGDHITYEMASAPGWIYLDPVTGDLSGTPRPEDRGIQSVVINAIDNFGASSNAILEIFVTGALPNQPPTLANPVVLPASPIPRDEITVQVTFFDPDDDFPALLEVIVDGRAIEMDPVNPLDIVTTDGKDYFVRLHLAAGNHTLAFRVSDGVPGHADLEPIRLTLHVEPDTLLSLDNAFLAMLASVAGVLALMVYYRSSPGAARAAQRAKRKPEEPEDRVEFLEGATLHPIPPSPPLKEPAKADRTAELEEEAARLAREAKEAEEEAERQIEEIEKDEKSPRDEKGRGG